MVVKVQVIFLVMAGWLFVDFISAMLSSERNRAKKMDKLINSIGFALTVAFVCFIFASKN